LTPRREKALAATADVGPVTGPLSKDLRMLDLINLLRRELIIRLRGDESGVVYVEYALLVTLIALVIVGGASLLGNNINGLFTNIASYVASITTP
jgi:pilus assembly protein Flp/PilA